MLDRRQLCRRHRSPLNATLPHEFDAELPLPRLASQITLPNNSAQ
jgi:hypothetical protein